MFNFRNERSRSGPRTGTETQRRERGPAQRMRDQSRGSGSEDWGQEWGEDWRGDSSSQSAPPERYSEAARHGGPWYQQDTPAGQRRGSWGEQGYGAADTGGTGHPYSSGYGGYRPAPPGQRLPQRRTRIGLWLPR